MEKTNKLILRVKKFKKVKLGFLGECKTVFDIYHEEYNLKCRIKKAKADLKAWKKKYKKELSK